MVSVFVWCHFAMRTAPKAPPQYQDVLEGGQSMVKVVQLGQQHSHLTGWAGMLPTKTGVWGLSGVFVYYLISFWRICWLLPSRSKLFWQCWHLVHL
jgi:hypothetical protein